MWASAAGCMRNYLILRERAAAFRADPEVAGGAAARRGWTSWRSPPPRTACAGLLADRAPSRSSTCEAAAARGMAFEQLDQLAMDHLLGARG